LFARIATAPLIWIYRFALRCKGLFLHPNLSRSSSSKLARVLEDPLSQAAAAPQQDTAERLSLLLGVFDAMTLHTAHQSIAKTAAVEMAPAPVPASRTRAGEVGLEEQFQQVRTVLVNAIKATADEAEEPDLTGSRAPRGRVPTLSASKSARMAELLQETGIDFALYRQRYLDVQRNMELMIAPLRAHAREALSAASPELRPLAALDAVWEQLLSVREQKLLATVPVLLKKRFDELRKKHQEDDPNTWRQPGGWLHLFGQELQQTLLAELDVRLEPVLGLIEAFSKEVKKSP
jgi:hypothetical protein